MKLSLHIFASMNSIEVNQIDSRSKSATEILSLGTEWAKRHVFFLDFPWTRNDYVNQRFPFIDLTLLVLPGHGINRNVALENDAKVKLVTKGCLGNTEKADPVWYQVLSNIN